MNDAEIKAFLGDFKPKLTIRNAAEAHIPPGYAGWCHRCEIAFKTFEDTMVHVREVHQLKG